ncbi:NADPH-dependent oxidoreductase [Chitinophaga silvatica]|uniref:NADPH-dependent oxidoreductase n=1 Tax=Chitinophaga silvatica TaxID=2282649 RepID=A0A3E1YG17_9BACT|nr:NAD(P)H-dependent oxidoreductase [Chitinophaga silvatica]RFS26337.1 NADPH-dependent oxidoreductase [Chitinophaga silvatica]
MKIAVLIGSIRQGRQSHKIGYYLSQQLNDKHHEVEVLDLATISLPMLEERVGKHPQLPDAALKMSHQLHTADAIILVTPEYHGSFSGVLKNAMDYFSAEFHKKVIGVVGVSAGKFGGINAVQQLSQVVINIGAYCVPTRLLVPEIYGAFNEKQELVNEHTLRSSQKFLDEFEWLASAINGKKMATAS